MFAAVVVLPSSGCALVTTRILVPSPLIFRDQRGPQRTERFAEIVRHVRRRQQRMLVAADRRHQAEERQPQPPGDVFRRLDRVVHVVEAERDADRRAPARRASTSSTCGGRSATSAPGHLGAIDDPHVVRRGCCPRRAAPSRASAATGRPRGCSSPRAPSRRSRCPCGSDPAPRTSRPRGCCASVCSCSTAVSYSFFTDCTAPGDFEIELPLRVLQLPH